MMSHNDIMVCNGVFEGLSGENTDKEGTTREGRQRSGIFMCTCNVGGVVLQVHSVFCSSAMYTL